MTGLPEPFVEINDAQKVFGGVPNLEAAVEACPDPYPDMAAWGRLVDFIHQNDQLSEAQAKELNGLIKPEHAKHAAAMYKYTQAIIATHGIRHVVKRMVAGWCFSQFLREPPSFVR